jgi:hypothetical protein
MANDDDGAWLENPDGAVMACPIAEMEVRPMLEQSPHLLVRLRYYLPGNAPPEPARGRVQLAIGPNAARLFAQSLQKELDTLDRFEPPRLN